MATKNTEQVVRDHESTWGTSEEAKRRWTDKNADSVRRGVDRQNKETDDA